jgi:tetratricopeptide (TPR) repeat protein
LWIFRLTALVLAPLVTFALLEVILRLAGYGYPTSFFLSRRINDKPCLIQNDRFGWRFFGATMSRTPCLLLLAQPKPKDLYRIFVLGESAAYGDPQPAYGLPRMLEALLEGRYPGTRFEVVNVAMTAINSNAILPIARDCARQDGDLWVLYMGNNEVVGPYGAGTVFGPQAPALALIRASLAFKATKTGQWMDSIRERLARRSDAGSEWGGMMMFVKHQVRHDDPRMKAVYAHFQSNLADILKAGVRSGARVVVSTVASNLKDCAPFASMHRSDLSMVDQAEWNRLYEAGIERQKAGRPSEAADQYRRASQIDDGFADLQFRWAQCCLALGQTAEAVQHFTLARDYDTLRFRSDSRLNALIRQTAQGREEEGIFLVDGQEALTQASPHGLIGEEMLYEHVHLRFEGNYLLARSIANKIAGLLPETITGQAQAGPDWPSADRCARRLAWTDYNRREALTSILGRLNDPPFTSQLNHAQQCRQLQDQIEQLLPASTSAGLLRAIAAYREALAQSPDDRFLYENLGYLQQKGGDLSGALESWRRLSQLLPHYSQAQCQMGLLLTLQKHHDEAIRVFEEALRLDPDSFVALDGMANALAVQGKKEEAVRQYEKALRIKPFYSPSHLSLGLLLKSMGREKEANVHFKLAQQHPMNTAATLHAVAKVCYDQGLMEEAVTNFNKALDLDPMDATIHLNLGMALVSLKRQAEAQRHYAEAVRLDPNLAEAHFRLGFELGRQGKDAEAMGHFAESVRLKPEFIEARVNLGVALMHQGRNEEAIQNFQEVLRADPANATALKHMKALGQAVR